MPTTPVNPVDALRNLLDFGVLPNTTPATPATPLQHAKPKQGRSATPNQAIGVRTTTSGVVGVSWNEEKQKWRAYISPGRRINLGSFTDIKDAIKAREDAEKLYGIVNPGPRSMIRQRGAAPLTPRAKPTQGKFSDYCPPEELRQLLICDYDKGTLTWRTRPEAWFAGCVYPKQVYSSWTSQHADKPAMTSEGNKGIRQGDIGDHWYDGHLYKRRTYEAHMVIWAMKHGKWAKVVHINGNRSDNRISNLQEVVTRAAAKSGGVAGVNWNKDYRRWYAVISVGGKQRHLGSFTTEEAAIAARKAAEKEYRT